LSKETPILTSFNSGELSDLMRGRTDLEQYYKGGLDFKNMLAMQYGPALMRPGTMHVEETKTMAETSRLLEMVLSDTSAYIIEMGKQYFRFYTSAGQIAGPYEVASTYTEAEVPDVHYAQSNDVITLVHSAHKPAKLTRLTASTFSLADYDFQGTPYLNPNVNSTKTLTPSVTAKDATGTLTATGHAPFVADHVGSFWRVGAATGTPAVQGYVKVTGFTSSTVVNITVMQTLAAASATDNWAEGAWSDHRGWPSRVGYHQKRLWLGNTTTEPNGIWGSKPFVYDNFDQGTALASDGISEKIPDASDIRWILGGNSLLVGTDKGDYSGRSSDNSSVLTPASISFSRQTGWESKPIQPRVIGTYAYEVQSKGRKLRETFYYFDEDTYKASDTTAIAEHITKSGIKEIAYQRNPYSILYCVLNNGKMACMTREADQQVLAWTPLDTDGEYESVAVIPHPTEDHDMVWAIVKRIINAATVRHVEYFESPIIPDRQDHCFYVDDGLRYNAYDQTTAKTLTLSAVTGTGITATAGAAHFAADDVGQRIRAIDADGLTLGELVITGFTSTTIVTGDVVLDFSTTSYAANRWGVSVNTISGFDHLEGETLKILADGGTHDNLVVASGDVTLIDNEDAFVVAGGLGFRGRWKNMPLEGGSVLGSAQGKIKRIYQSSFIFYRSLGMQAGGDEDHLDDIIFRDPDTLMGLVEPYFTGLFARMAINSTNDENGHIVIQQDEPLPLCILAVIPHVETRDV